MKAGALSFGAQLRGLREAAGFTQEELATIAGLSVHAVSALERGERRRPHVETVRALAAALDLPGATRDAFLRNARVRTQDAAVDGPTGASLPLVLTALLGRDADVQSLRHWLADSAARLITLVGPGGVGKTRLALELARGIAEDDATRVVFLELAAIRDSSFVASAVAEAFGLSDVPAVDLPKRVRAACAEQPTLLVLDNCEHVLDAVPLIAELLTAAASLRVLATSRAPLRVRGEREYAVEPLALDPDAGAMSPADLARAPAIRLFLERVRNLQPEFRLTTANASTVVAICRRLDALPLALELAARWIKVLSAEDLLSRLEHDVLPATVVGPRDLPERQQTMNATVAWSYQLLGAHEQRVFRCLGVLPGPFAIEAAAAVLSGRASAPAESDEPLAAAAGLIERSLLLRAEGAVGMRPLYRMLETVRAYAAFELTAAGEREDALEGLVRYCVGEASLAAEGMIGQAQGEWLDRVRDDLESYRGALTWLIALGRPFEACSIAWDLLFFWFIRGHAVEGLRWYEQILNLPTATPATKSTALTGAAVMWYAQGELDRARAALNRSLTLAGDGSDTALVAAMAKNLLGYVELAAGHVTAARDRFAESIEAFRALDVSWGTGNALTGMAWAALASGDETRAESLLDEARSPLDHAGPWFSLLGLYVRAILAVRRGRSGEAIALVRESLTSIRELHDKFAFVYALVPLAAAAVQKGDDAWAARILGARDAVTERTGATVVDNSVNDLRESSERETRARLGPDRWARAYAAGRNASIDSLLMDIDGAASRPKRSTARPA
jgi:predicted ATPase/DNA-binding XRE family transcriptional regulator